MADQDETKTTDDKPAVSFKTEGDFLKAVEKKAAPRIKEAAEKAIAEVLGKLGVDGVDALDAIKETLAKSEGTRSEADKAKTELDRTTKELRRLEKKSAELETFRTSSLKQRALIAHASKTHDIDTVSELLSSKLTVGDDGTVSTADGKSVDEAVEALLVAKPYLRNAGYKAGAGTGRTPPKAASTGHGESSDNGAKRPTVLEARQNLAKALEQAATLDAQTHP